VLRANHQRRSKLQEKRAARDYGGSVTPGSGNQWHSKADVHSDKLLIECKTTTKKSYAVKPEDFKKLYFQALVENKIPVLEIEFDDMTLVILDKNDFLANKDSLVQ
jgi:hypothetical protein